MKRKLVATIMSITMVMTFVPSTNMSYATTSKLKLSAKALTNTTISLSWNKYKKATKYVVYGRKTGEKYIKLSSIKSNKARKYLIEKISDDELVANKKYQFVVKAYKGSKKLKDSNTKTVVAVGPLDLNGTWKENNGSTSYQKAIIDGNTISIYWIDEEDKSESIYWIGTVDIPGEGITTASEYKWESKRDKEKTDTALLASQDDTKIFTYKNGKISYMQSMLGIKKIREIEKID